MTTKRLLANKTLTTNVFAQKIHLNNTTFFEKMQIDYEESYPSYVTYEHYEDMLEEKNREISTLQEEIYKKEDVIEKLEQEIKNLKGDNHE